MKYYEESVKLSCKKKKVNVHIFLSGNACKWQVYEIGKRDRTALITLIIYAYTATVINNPWSRAIYFDNFCMLCPESTRQNHLLQTVHR